MNWKSIIIGVALSATFAFPVFAESPLILRDSSQEAPGTDRADKFADVKLKAYALGILGTAIPAAAGYLLINSNAGRYSTQGGWLIAGGLFLGPSLGQFYAQAPIQGILGIGIRSLGGFLVFTGEMESLSGALCGMDFGGSNDEKCPESKNGTPLIIIGSVTYLGGLVYSLFDAGLAVNRQGKHASESQFGWSPTLSPSREGRLSPGAMAWMRF